MVQVFMSNMFAEMNSTQSSSLWPCGTENSSFVARGAEIERLSLLKEAWGGSSRRRAGVGGVILAFPANVMGHIFLNAL